MRPNRLAGHGLLVALALLLLVHSAPARAADRVLGFDELADQTLLASQYPLPQDPGKGLTFGQAPPTYELDYDTRILTVPAGQARSAPKLAQSLGAGEVCESPETSTWGRFAFARDRVRVYARVGTIVGGGTVRLRAYDAGGILVDAAGAASPPGGGLAALEVSTNGPKIVFIRIGGDNGCFTHRFDDLTFDDLASPPGSPSGPGGPALPPPDFGLARVSPQDSVIGVVREKFVDVGLGVTRVNGSTGPISYAVSGLPAGVKASFPDGPSTASDAPRIRLAASSGAGPADGKLVTVTGTPSAGAGSAPRQVTFKLDVHGRYDLRITGIEVTQGVQEQLTPCTQPLDCRTKPSLPFPPSDLERTVAYRGVRLAARKQTAVRVFANVKSGDSVSGVTAALRGYRNGKPLAGGPLLSSPRTLASSIFNFPWVTWNERTLSDQSFDFLLPPEWTTGEVSLRAELIGPLTFLSGPAECETQGCEDNNGMALAKIRFIPTGYVTMATAKLWHSGENVSGYQPKVGGKPQPQSDAAARLLPDPEVAFGLAEALLPLQEGGLDYDRTSYYATIDVSGLMVFNKLKVSGDALDKLNRQVAKALLADYADEYPGCAWADFCANSIVGVYAPDVTNGSGSSSGKLATVYPGILSAQAYRDGDANYAGYVGDQPIAVTSYANPVTGVHEVSHGLGRRHADILCGGNADGQVGEILTPDGRGTAEGVGLDLSTWPMNPVAARAFGSLDPDDRLTLTDYMSYCPNNAWTSVIGWEKNFTLLRRIAKSLLRVNAVKAASVAAPAQRGASPRAGAAQAANLLRVRASVGSTGAEISSVKPRRGRPAARPGASPLVVVARDADGAERSRTPMKVPDSSDEESGFVVGEADVPAAGVASLELRRDGRPVARRAASANRPVVKVLSPRRGRLVGRSRETVVRWRATDADRDPLLAKVDYSIDGGRSWEPIHLGPNSGRAALPSRFFAGSRRARIRVRVNDGFHEVAAESARFRAIPRGPSVEIVSPMAGRAVRADQTVGLQVDAHDDRGRRIRGRGQVRWYDGKRMVARGASTAVTGLRPGRRSLRVVVRDGGGGETVARQRVRVTPVTPQLLSLRTPDRVSRGARRLVLRVRSSVAATVRVTGGAIGRPAGVAVSRSSRRVTVRVEPGRKRLVLTVALHAGGRMRSVAVEVPRG